VAIFFFIIVFISGIGVAGGVFIVELFSHIYRALQLFLCILIKIYKNSFIICLKKFWKREVFVYKR